MHHLLYKTTNILNNRFYVGMHSTKNPKDRYLGSGKRIKYEIQKYGKENFKREILEEFPTRKALEDAEAEVVNEELLSDPLCLNLKNGGEGGGRIWNSNHAKKFHRAGWEAMHRNKDHVAAGLKSGKTREKRNQEGLYPPGTFTSHFGGMQHSEKSRAQMKNTHARNAHQRAEKNSNFGKRNACVNKDGKNKRIPLDQLEMFITDGWTKGLV